MFTFHPVFINFFYFTCIYLFKLFFTGQSWMQSNFISYVLRCAITIKTILFYSNTCKGGMQSRALDSTVV